MFTSGHPAQTQRLNTVAHLEFLRDHALPLSIDTYTQCGMRWKRLEEGVEARAPANDTISSASRTR